MVVWRIHDHWHLYRPEPMAAGLARALGWEKYLTEILVSHETGEEAGMTGFTEWHPTMAPGIQVMNIKTGDRLWIA